MRLRLWVAIVGMLLAVGATRLSAQVRFAPEADYGTDTDFGVGARANFDLTSLFKTRGFHGITSFDYFFPSGFNYWELNANLAYMIPGVRGNVHPYAGGGVEYGHASVDNCAGNCSSGKVGFNFLGGINIQTKTKLLPFVEGRLQLGHGDQFVFTGGLYF